MTTYKFGDVVLVPFPFTDQRASKKRPAVIVSSGSYHADHINLILMVVSSQVSTSLRAGEVALRDWKKAGLIGDSVVKAVITTVERNPVIRKLGARYQMLIAIQWSTRFGDSRSITLRIGAATIIILPSGMFADRHCFRSLLMSTTTGSGLPSSLSL